MRFFHFTYAAAIDTIRKEGIRPSTIQVPKIGPSLAPVVSLTNNPDPSPLLYKSLWDGSEYFGDVLKEYRKSDPDGPIPHGPNTVAKRIVLEIPEEDLNIYPMIFPDIAPLGFPDQDSINEFMTLGGGEQANWCVYYGILPPEYIVDVEDVDRASLSI
ncbi:hypothetical protein [Sphingomonas faeni]|uniref:hypothetical protein n=1 Tax=Sphingomonas faeni TaxID=185950 RepID=UPI00335370E4